MTSSSQSIAESSIHVPLQAKEKECPEVEDESKDAAGPRPIVDIVATSDAQSLSVKLQAKISDSVHVV